MSYVRESDAPLLAAPAGTIGAYAWAKDRLFPTPFSALGTIIIASLFVIVGWSLLDWGAIRAVWSAPDRELCAVNGAGACWPFVFAKFQQWIYGLYPFDQRWRIDILYALCILAVAGLVIPQIPGKRWTALFFFVIFPVISFFMLLGGYFGLPLVETDYWGGLTLTLVIAITGNVVSLPFGILLALGRQSQMPVVRILSVVFIEAVRGVPFITVLFMASVMFPLFMPPGVNPDKLLKAVIGTSIFASAYMAEVVRGGLQAIPKGQIEAAQALGLSYWKMMRLIVMPQALKIVIPGIVNSFISLFQDTSLVSIIGLFDLLGMVQAGFNDAKWKS
ncbi:MAG: amino acid ABC transporter permease, partial [Aestuariivirga sp.]